jgi:putative oxidoreductase
MTTVSRLGWDDIGKLVLRVAIGALLFLHGVAKLKSGIGWMAGPLAQFGLPAFVGYAVFIGEIIAPVLLLVGTYTRLAGLVIAVNMLSAIMLVQRGKIGALNQGGGWGIELEMLFLLGGVAIFFLGAGKFSLSRGQARWD